MGNLKSMLSLNHRGKSKDELIQLIQKVAEGITLPEFKKVIDLDPKTELESLNKKDLLGILSDMNDAYAENIEIWESSFDKIESISNLGEIKVAAIKPTDLAASLNNIDFSNMIAGPLTAAVDAQNKSSIATVDFIQNVGLEDDEGVKKVRMVDFGYTKSDGTSVELKVPFLTMLNIPALRIETVEINFNCKLNSVQTAETSSATKIGAEVSGGWGPVRAKVSASHQRTSNTGEEVKQEFSLGVLVKATNDALPAGLEKVLNLLGEDVPTPAPEEGED